MHYSYLFIEDHPYKFKLLFNFREHRMYFMYLVEEDWYFLSDLFKTIIQLYIFDKRQMFTCIQLNIWKVQNIFSQIQKKVEVNFEIRPTSLRLNPLYSTISMLLRFYLRAWWWVGGFIIMIIILITVMMMIIFIIASHISTTHLEQTDISQSSCLLLSICFLFVFYLLTNFEHWMSNILHFAMLTVSILNICSALCSSSSCKSCSALCC